MMRFHLRFLDKSEKTLQKHKGMKNKQTKNATKRLVYNDAFSFMVFGKKRKNATKT